MAVIAFTSAGNAHAATSFTDRSAFIAQTSPQASIDFENVAAGSSYFQQDLTVGNMTLNVPGGVFGFQLIAPGGQCGDVGFDAFDIDGSQYACSFIASQLNMTVDFNAPVTAWGADFGSLGDEGRRVKLAFLDDDANVIADFIAEGSEAEEVRFLGFDFEGLEATRLIFSYLISGISQEQDIFGMDNVLFSTARGAGTPNPVPVPPAMLLFASAGGAFALLRRRKGRP
ncbi:MAG: hypothetical protein AAF862_06415 [Pseudomonadota bacterium]